MSEIKEARFFAILADEVTSHNKEELSLCTVRMAEAAGVDPTTPRVCGRQSTRCNIPTGTVQQHYQLNVAIPFVDHVINELEQRFSGI